MQPGSNEIESVSFFTVILCDSKMYISFFLIMLSELPVPLLNEELKVQILKFHNYLTVL